jgi:hypothetical protein
MSTNSIGSNLANVEAQAPAYYRHSANIQNLFKNHIITQIMSECV